MGRYELKYTAEEIDELLESVDEKTIYSDATVQTHGLMAASDKEKLDDLPTAMEIEHYLDGKANKKVPSRAGNFAKLNDIGDLADSGYFVDDFATAQQGHLAQTAYQKPQKGIPYSDLENDVKSSLDKADTALQSFTEQDPTVPSWAKERQKPIYNYDEIRNTPDLSGFITKSVNDLANYYLKSETYTKAEVTTLIGAIQQFHYEIYASLPQNGESNVLYLIGPTGSGSDRYEEYVYANNAFTKIGDTSIDLSGYVTTSALNTALASYATTQDLGNAVSILPSYGVEYSEQLGDTIKPISFISGGDSAIYAVGEGNADGNEDFILSTTDYVDNAIGGLATVATSGSYNDLKNKPTIPAAQVNSDWNASSGVAQILNKPTIPTVPTNVSAFTNDAGYLTQHQSLTNYVQKSKTAGLLKNDGTVDTNTYLTQHQDISGKADKVVYVDASTPPSTMDSNKVYQYGTLSGDTTFPAFTAVSSGDTEIKIWCWTFTTPSTAPTITWPAGITAWNGGQAPTISANKQYEVSVMDGIACIVETDIPSNP